MVAPPPARPRGLRPPAWQTSARSKKRTTAACPRAAARHAPPPQVLFLMSGSPEANLQGEELVAAIMAHNYVITNIDMLDENTGGRVPSARPMVAASRTGLSGRGRRLSHGGQGALSAARAALRKESCRRRSGRCRKKRLVHLMEWSALHHKPVFELVIIDECHHIQTARAPPSG